MNITDGQTDTDTHGHLHCCFFADKKVAWLVMGGCGSPLKFINFTRVNQELRKDPKLDNKSILN